MKVCLLEPFHTGSHAIWAEEYQRFSSHDVELLTLPGRHWKWRMHGGAVSLANEFLQTGYKPDLLLATDMLDLTTFLALTREATAGTAAALYFHENQLTYPWSPTDADPATRRDAHYAFINYTSALAADALLFNSAYHRDSFLGQLPDFLTSFPDCNELGTLEQLKKKSSTLALGLNLKKLDDNRPADTAGHNSVPTILWNHRWEYDKNPDEFFRALYILQEEGYDFNLVILGESYRNSPPVFAEAREKLGSRILHSGYAKDFADYARWLWRADILPVTSHHDFFGASVVQAIHCHCTPLLPRRMAYPEHLPDNLHDQYLYHDFSDLLAKLRNRLQAGGNHGKELAGHIAAYDWSVMAKTYDEQLELLTLQPGSR